MRKHRIIPFLFLSILLGACGGGDSRVSEPSTPSTFPAHDQVADDTRVKAMSLTLEDMPAGYVKSTHIDPRQSISLGPLESSACAEVELPAPSSTARGEGFAKNEETPSFQTIVYSEVEMYKTSTDAKASFAAYSDQNYRLCLRRYLEQLADYLLVNGFHVRNPLSNTSISSIAELTGVDTVGLRLAGTTTIDRQTTNLYIDVIALTNDRVELVTTLATTEGRPSSGVELGLVGKMRNHVSTAIGNG